MKVWYRYTWFRIDSVRSSFKHGIQLSGIVKEAEFLS